MFEKRYRQRLEADLAQWEEAGLLPAAAGAAIRAQLGSQRSGVDIVTIVAIAGGLLIAAAFLVFVAANWAQIARPLRFLILLAGIVTAYVLGAYFAQAGRKVLADLCATVGTIVFGAAIALVGQMYHLGEDFTGGLLFWAVGALIAALLTASRGALAVALVVASVWSGARLYETGDSPHLPFIGFWLVCAALAVAWKAPSARHLVALAAVVWWVVMRFAQFDILSFRNPGLMIVTGGAFMLGAGMLTANLRGISLRAFGQTLSDYAAFMLAIGLPIMISTLFGARFENVAPWIWACAAAGIVMCFIAAAIARRAGPAFAGLAAAFAVAVMVMIMRTGGNENWAAYALSLMAMLCLVVSGMLDDARPRLVAGWVGLACVIAAITWVVQGSLLHRSFFLAIAGAVAIGIAVLLGRVIPKGAAS